MSVDWVRDGNDAEAALADQEYALILLDLGLPGRGGLELLRAYRTRRAATPVLIVTARDDVDSRVEGLDLGADDYIVKPFEIRELLARMRAVVRRRHGGQAMSILTAGDLQLDLESHQVTFLRDPATGTSGGFPRTKAGAPRPPLTPCQCGFFRGARRARFEDVSSRLP